MAGLYAEDNIAMTPYSPLAGGRLSRHPGDFQKTERRRLCEGSNDAAAEQDGGDYPPR